MDFFQILTKEIKGGALEVYPDFIVGRSKDLMIRGQSFYAVWDDEKGLWSTDEFDVRRLVDDKVVEYARKLEDEGKKVKIKLLRSYETGRWNQFKKYMKNVSDDYTQLDMQLAFANTKVKKTDHISRRLPYNLEEGDHSAWDELLETLYSPIERAKIEWCIGAIVSGDSKKIEKFLVFYGPGGTGKSTIMKIIQKLFVGYVAMFDAKALTTNGNSFSTEVFRSNPLVAIQHDGDLSNIQDNTRLNSIVSHEDMTVNEKYKSTYETRVNAFLFMGTNQPVRISDAKSGLIRRLIDVHPTGTIIPAKQYHALMSRIDFELGAIAHHCLNVYRSMGKNYYNAYRPVEMMLQTDLFFNFIEAHFDIFKEQDSTTLKQAWALYKEFCNDSGVEKPLQRHKFRAELQNYFGEFKDRITINGRTERSYFSGFKAQPFKMPVNNDVTTFSLVMDEVASIFDTEFADQPAQGFKVNEFDMKIPVKEWSKVKTTLADINTSELHFVKIPTNHIVIDFDLKDDKGNKSLEKNLEAASAWPATYAEISQGGNGVHLHYTYDGDVTQLAQRYSDGVEVKTLLGDASLRRRLSKCNNIPVATISSGLPFKEKKMLNPNVMHSEKSLRELIERNLRKEIHPGTKPSVDFIKKILDDAYESGMTYDVTDMRSKIIAFANNSSNQPLPSLKIVQKMKFKSDDICLGDGTTITPSPKVGTDEDDRLVFFDLEVYVNLFVVCWKYRGDANIVRMINPSPQEVEALFRLKLIGYNNRRYDNHILWARMLGYDNEQLYKLSQKIMNKDVKAMFSQAYDVSYTDIYDFTTLKQSLKKYQIDLGIPHKEMDIPWDQPVPDDRIDDVVEYCCNDVLSTEATFEARQGDYVGRLILADLSGLTPNDTTQKHTARIVFGNDRNPQRSFVYTKLEKEFPGYEHKMGKSTYRGEEIGEGGLVRAKPGMYQDVVLLDIESMHPTSIRELNAFGEYTPNFTALVDAQLALKHGDFDTVKKAMGGRLAPYIEDIEKTRTKDPEAAKREAKTLRNALKIAVNIVYGLTSAKFDNPFRDIRNVDNIVAKRGALFMIDLMHFVEEAGFDVVHIKTDSIKIPGATQWIIEEIVNFGRKYGYEFNREATYDKFCLVNDAVYIACETELINKLDPEGKHPERAGIFEKRKKWTAVGAQFQHPYVFKTLFDPGPYSEDQGVTFDDLCETKQVTKGAIYIDFERSAEPDISKMHFVGRTGRFVPVHEDYQGGILYRVMDGKTYAISGSKGYFWMEAEVAKTLPGEAINMSYFEKLAEDARKTIEKFGDFEGFIS